MDTRLNRRLAVSAGVASLVGINSAKAAPDNPPRFDAQTELAQKYATSQSAKNPSAIAATFAADGIYIDTGNNKNGKRVGQAAIQAYFQQLFAAYPNLQFHVDGITPHIEPRVNTQIVSFSVAWTFNGTHTVTTDIASKATNNQVIIHGDDLLEILVSGTQTQIVKVYSFYPADEFMKQDLGAAD